MYNDSLIQYIKAVQAQGFSEPAIRDVLAQNGWKASDIENAFSYLALSKVPVPPQAPGMAVAPQTQNVSPVSTALIKENFNSPYSIGLAIVTFVSLMLLSNKIIDDSASYASSPNQKLIFDACIIIPFLVIAFILHGSFSETKKRFLVLCQPYFAVSAFLLVRLLWDTSWYVLSTQATYGVYVVLILVILVLTGLIMFVRKYMLA